MFWKIIGVIGLIAIICAGLVIYYMFREFWSYAIGDEDDYECFSQEATQVREET